MDPELQQALAQFEGRLNVRIDGVESHLDVVESHLDSVESGLNARIGAVESSLNARIGAVETSLNARIGAVETSLNARIGAVESSLNVRIDAVETGLRSYIEERSEMTETKLLSAFHNWAQTFEVRARGTSAAVREFDERLGLIEDRVAKLERSR